MNSEELILDGKGEAMPKVQESIEELRGDMKAYLAGMLDAEGSIKFSVRQRQDGNRKLPWSLLPEIEINQYLAGIWDGDGTIQLKIQRDSRLKNYYQLNPSVSTSLVSGEIEMFNSLFDTFCKRNGIRYCLNKVKKENRKVIYRWLVTGINHVEKFLNLLKPYLILKQKECRIMLEEIMPRMKEKKHLTEEGILDIMQFADKLAKLHGHQRNGRKYSQKYFQELWLK